MRRRFWLLIGKMSFAIYWHAMRRASALTPVELAVAVSLEGEGEETPCAE